MEPSITIVKLFSVLNSFLTVCGLVVTLCALYGIIYLIVIIARLKAPKSLINMMILLLAIFSGMYLILSLAIRFFEIGTLFEVPFGLEGISKILMNFALLFLALSWYVPNYHPVLYSKYSVTFKYGVGVFFLLVSLGLAAFLIAFHILELSYFYMYIISDVTCLPICCLIVISLTILKRIRKPLSNAHKTAFAFSISQVLLAMSAASTLERTLLALVRCDEFCGILYEISIYLYVSQPIVLLFMLRRSHKDFRMAQLKCCRGNVQNYNNDDLESNSGSQASENNVAFHRSSENIQL